MMRPASLGTKVYGILVKRAESVLLSYTKQRLHLLPAPYTTNCRDYDAEGLSSQQGCMTQCLKKWSMMAKLALPSTVPVILGENVSILNPESMSKARRGCQRRCVKVACYIEQYDVVEHFRANRAKPHTEIGVRFPLNRELLVSYKPKTTMVEYLTLFGSQADTKSPLKRRSKL